MSAPAVTEPGVYELDESVYHADAVAGRSLSVSGCKRLLPPSCPAMFAYERDFGRAPKAAFDFGHAAHAVVLGTGAPLVVVDAKDWRTKAAQEARDAAYEAGSTPILPGEYAQVQGMAAALREHPTAAALLEPKDGAPEQSLFWRDEPTGTMLRSRLDWLPHVNGSRMVIADYKTCAASDLASIIKAVHTFGYHMQAAFYRAGVQALGLDDDPAFVLIFQSKTAPYLVQCVEPDDFALEVGAALNRKAIDLYAHCTATDTWPGWGHGITRVSLPPWAATDLDMETTA